EHDLVPRADLAIELFDEGTPAVWRGYQAPHTVDTETLAPGDRAEALRRARSEAEDVLVPVPEGSGSGSGSGSGLDLAMVVGTAAATGAGGGGIAGGARGAGVRALGR